MLDPDAHRGVKKPWACSAEPCTPRHRLDRPLDPQKLAPSAESDALLDGGELTHCPAHDLHAAGQIISWWRMCDGRLSELRGVGIEQPSAGMCDAWLTVGDEVAKVDRVNRKRAAAEAERQAEAAKASKGKRRR